MYAVWHGQWFYAYCAGYILSCALWPACFDSDMKSMAIRLLTPLLGSRSLLCMLDIAWCNLFIHGDGFCAFIHSLQLFWMFRCRLEVIDVIVMARFMQMNKFPSTEGSWIEGVRWVALGYNSVTSISASHGFMQDFTSSLCSSWVTSFLIAYSDAGRDFMSTGQRIRSYGWVLVQLRRLLYFCPNFLWLSSCVHFGPLPVAFAFPVANGFVLSPYWCFYFV